MTFITIKKPDRKTILQYLVAISLILLVTACSTVKTYYRSMTEEDQSEAELVDEEQPIEEESTDSVAVVDENAILIQQLQRMVDSLQFQVDSLSLELETSNSRVAVCTDFMIPDSIVFAGTTFNLHNERIYAKFEEIYQNELKSAHRFIPRSGKYFPVFDSIFTEQEVPLDAKYLAIAESGLNTVAQSWVGAMGPWQFMKTTAKGYDLKIDNFVDERRNVFKSTVAAAKYLKNAKRMLSEQGADDWLLAMAAYNAGPGAIIREVKNQGGKDFFSLIMRVDETNRYVWRAVAIKMIFENEEAIFGKKFERETSLLDETRSVKLNLKGHYKIDDWAKAQGTTVSKVWEYNPWIEIYQTKRTKYTPINEVVLPPGEFDILLPKESVPDTGEIAKIEKKFLEKNSGYFKYHTVQAGDNLYNIARKYKTTVANIKAINNLKNDTIHPGQKLKLHGTPGSGGSSSSGGVYVVNKGDSISSIAKHLKVTSSHLIAKNNLKVKDNGGSKVVIIYPGQKLKY